MGAILYASQPWSQYGTPLNRFPTFRPIRIPTVDLVKRLVFCLCFCSLPAAALPFHLSGACQARWQASRLGLHGAPARKPRLGVLSTDKLSHQPGSLAISGASNLAEHAVGNTSNAASWRNVVSLYGSLSRPDCLCRKLADCRAAGLARRPGSSLGQPGLRLPCATRRCMDAVDDHTQAPANAAAVVLQLYLSNAPEGRSGGMMSLSVRSPHPLLAK